MEDHYSWKSFASPLADKYKIFIFFFYFDPVTVGEVEFYLVNGTGGNGHKSLFTAFSFHFDEALVEIKIGQLEVDKFWYAKSAAI